MTESKWARLELIYELESPLHIGYLPAKGSVVASTRYYVPGKNFWGAVTKLATESLFKNPIGKYYQDIGEKIREYFRFSYFYILEDDEIYYPSFSKEGLVYGSSKKITKDQFEDKFVGSRVSTAIDFSLKTAQQGTLHEIGFIKNKYRDERGNIKNARISGVVWVRKDAELSMEKGNVLLYIKEDGVYANGLNLLKELTLGGEQNYGFGRVKLIGLSKKQKLFFGEENLAANDVIITVKNSNPIISHVKVFRENKDGNPVYFCGDIELLSGREYPSRENERFKKPGKYIVLPEYYYSPGTVFLSKGQNDNVEIDFVLKHDGIMKAV
ncbi:MAG TPA: hypothetical protein DD719_05985 [Desulfotomaculum sp.]|nr:hypothetical protein [Desulfotomaculum sp.]